MSGEHQKRYNHGDSLLARDLNHRSESIERIENLSAVSPMAVTQTASGLHLIRRTRRNILARLSGGSSPYSWVKIQEEPDGLLSLFPDVSGTSNAYEVNNVAGLENQIVELVPDPFGDWRFQWIGYGNTTYPDPIVCSCWTYSQIPDTLDWSILTECSVNGAAFSTIATTSGTMTKHTASGGGLGCTSGFSGTPYWYGAVTLTQNGSSEACTTGSTLTGCWETTSAFGQLNGIPSRVVCYYLYYDCGSINRPTVILEKVQSTSNCTLVNDMGGLFDIDVNGFSNAYGELQPTSGSATCNPFVLVQVNTWSTINGLGQTFVARHTITISE